VFAISQIVGKNPEHSNGAGHSQPRLKLLLADDNPALLREFQRVLGKEFEIVSTVADGRALLEQYDRLRPEVIVTDISMPLMDGFEVQARLAESSAPVPVVTITGHDSTETRDRAMAAHPAVYLRKPVDDQTLLDAIEVAIRHGLKKRIECP